MKAARLVVLTVAIAAGGVAALLAGRSDKPPEVKPEPMAKTDTIDVLVARSDISMGTAVSPGDVQWQAWPRVAQNENDYQYDYRLRHPITLKEGERTVEVFLGRNRGGLTPSQRADVLSFAQLWRREATGGIIVDVPHGGPTDHAAADSMREIHSIFAASGVPRNAVYVRDYRPSDSSLASIKINYSKLVAAAGPCGRWPQNLGPGQDVSYTENRPYWNLGCASQRNLAAMVDNPADLVQPRGESPSYTGRRSVAIEKYRKGESPSGKYDGYDTGKIGDVGK